MRVDFDEFEALTEILLSSILSEDTSNDKLMHFSLLSVIYILFAPPFLLSVTYISYLSILM